MRIHTPVTMLSVSRSVSYQFEEHPFTSSRPPACARVSTSTLRTFQLWVGTVGAADPAAYAAATSRT